MLTRPEATVVVEERSANGSLKGKTSASSAEKQPSDSKAPKKKPPLDFQDFLAYVRLPCPPETKKDGECATAMEYEEAEPLSWWTAWSRQFKVDFLHVVSEFVENSYNQIFEEASGDLVLMRGRSYEQDHEDGRRYFCDGCLADRPEGSVSKAETMRPMALRMVDMGGLSADSKRRFVQLWSEARHGLAPAVFLGSEGEVGGLAALRRLAAPAVSLWNLKIADLNPGSPLGFDRHFAGIISSTLGQLLGLYRSTGVRSHGHLTPHKVELILNGDERLVLVTGFAEAIICGLKKEAAPLGPHSPPEAFRFNDPTFAPSQRAEDARKADAWSVGMLCFLLCMKQMNHLPEFSRLQDSIEDFKSAWTFDRVRAREKVFRRQEAVRTAFKAVMENGDTYLANALDGLLELDPRKRLDVGTALQRVNGVFVIWEEIRTGVLQYREAQRLDPNSRGEQGGLQEGTSRDRSTWRKVKNALSFIRKVKQSGNTAEAGNTTEGLEDARNEAENQRTPKASRKDRSKTSPEASRKDRSKTSPKASRKDRSKTSPKASREDRSKTSPKGQEGIVPNIVRAGLSGIGKRVVGVPGGR